jgi:hypothetical protein
MGALLTCLGLFVVLVVAHYFINVMHLMVVRSELQNAVDAAALAGAGYLYKSPEEVEAAALKVAAGNFADGLRVSKKSPGTQISVTAFPGDGVFPGCVKVQATRRIKFFGGAFCGLPESTSITTNALSGTAGSVISVNENQLFPLALSVDAIPMDRTLAESPLTGHHLGDSIVLFTSSQRGRNAAFTTFSHPSDDTDYLKAALDQCLTPKPGVSGLIPKVNVGDSINLNNSIFGTHLMAIGDHAAALARQPILTVPVIVGNPQGGDKATVVGFATFRVVGYRLSPGGQELDALIVTMVKGMVRGVSRPLPSTNKEAVDDALFELSTGIPKLLSPDYLRRKLWLQRRQSEASTIALNHEDRLLPASAQRALRLAGPTSSTVVPVSVVVSGAAANSAMSSRSVSGSAAANSQAEQDKIGNADAANYLWLLWLLLSIPLAVVAIRFLTRERAGAANAPATSGTPQRSGRRARKLPKSPYARQLVAGGDPTNRK